MNIRRRVAWAFMAVAAASLLAFGAVRDTGPLTQAERIDSISRRIACPTCDGESVYVSRASAAEAIRNQVARDVAAGRLGDDEIVASIADAYDAQVLLVPRATGFDSLVWILPVAVLVASVAGLWSAFRRWGERDDGRPTREDEALVARLLAADDPDNDEPV
ncbi:MAG: cytochrome c biosis protein CcmH [Actinomycetota bacterium]